MGALGSVRSAVILPPAEAMRPPAPENFRAASVDGALTRRLDSPTRIILRQIARAPFRAAQTVIGVALSVAVLVLAMQWTGVIETILDSQFSKSQRQNATIGFHQPVALDGRFALARLPGVLAVEPLRVAAADLRAGPRVHRGAITGLPSDARLQAIHDVRGWYLPGPRGGLVLGTKLAEKLDVAVGDMVSVEVLDGAHSRFDLPVAALHETYIEMPAYLDIAVLNRELGDPPVFEMANLLLDPAEERAFYETIKEIPGLSAVIIKQRSVDKMREEIGDMIWIFTSFFVMFSTALAYGVVYNAVRVALSERGRDLATLRVLGFTRWEISYILLGEAALLALIALPLGCLAGAGLVYVMAGSFDTELFRIPFDIRPSAYGQAMLIALAASLASAAFARRRIDRLDLIAVLKTRE